MDKLTDHLFIFEGEGKITDFNGRYLDYRAYIEEKERDAQKALKAKKDQEKAAAEKVAEKANTQNKLTYKEKKEFEALEVEIEALETQKADIEKKLSSGEITDHEELQKLSEQISQLIEVIDEKTMLLHCFSI